MRIVDLTLPLVDGMEYFCTGNLPWEVPFGSEITVPADSGLQAGSLTMFTEPGTRFIAVAGNTIGEVLKNELPGEIMRDAAVLRIPKEPQKGTNMIAPEES